MLNRLVLVAISAAATAGVVTTPRFVENRLADGAADASVWDSVYTADQAARGDTLYNAGCVKCHGAALAGGDDGSPLAGDAFLGNWEGTGLDELYSQIRKSMPPDNPNSIPREQVPDLIGFILSKNGFPAGTTPLPDDLEKLKNIKVLKAKP